MEVLRQELERLNVEIIEASEERAQAAEYGLVVLEEKQALQQQHDELSSLYESTKNELETSVNVSPEYESTPENECPPCTSMSPPLCVSVSPEYTYNFPNLLSIFIHENCTSPSL